MGFEVNEMQDDKNGFVSAPDEIEYLQKISQMTDEEEIDKAEKEYLAHCKAYFEWLRKNKSVANN
jgi:hypothetical protein